MEKGLSVVQVLQGGLEADSGTEALRKFLQPSSPHLEHKVTLEEI